MLRSLWLRKLSSALFGRPSSSRKLRRYLRRTRLNLEHLENRITPSTTITVNSAADAANYASTVTVSQLNPNTTPVTLIDAINAANNTSHVSGGSYVISLQLPANGGDVVQLGSVNNNWYGPDALPAISSNITIEGNGDELYIEDAAKGGANMRFFYVSGGPSFTGGALSAGTLELDDLTLSDGVAQGGSGYEGGGGGLGAGGAIFNQGTLTLNDATLFSNQAIGGNAVSDVSDSFGGGGGMGGSADSSGDGGGFGGSFSISGGPSGGSGAGAIGGGGVGFTSHANGSGGSSYLTVNGASVGNGGGRRRFWRFRGQRRR